MANLLEQNGGGPQKQPKYVPVFMDRSFTGSWTQRCVLHDPSDVYTARYYGGRPDALWMGSNIELTNNLTLRRRPGLTPFSTFVYPLPPDRAYSFQLTNGTIRVIVDTAASPNLVISSTAGPIAPLTLSNAAAAVGNLTQYLGTITGGAGNALAGQVFTITGFTNSKNNGTFLCAASSAGVLTLYNANGILETHAGVATSLSSIYTGTITNGANNAYAGLIFKITGLLNNSNNGTFLCTASTALTLTLTNPIGQTETDPGNAITSGAVYWDEQNGSAQLLFAKSPGAGQTYFQGSGGILYMGDGVDTRKYTPLNPNAPYSVPGSIVTVGGIAASAYTSYPANPLYPLAGTPGQGVSVWNWGITPPTFPPSVVVVESGAASAQWQGSPQTVWSTMGLVYDATTGLAFQLNSVNAQAATVPNTTQFGESGSGQPLWPPVGGTVVDGSVTWTNYGIISTWKPGTTYSNASAGQGSATGYPSFIYDPGIGNGGTGAVPAVYANIADPPTSTTIDKASAYPQFRAGVGLITPDPNNGKGPSWVYIGIPSTWTKNTVIPIWGNNNSHDVGVAITEPVSLQNGLPANTPVYMMVSLTGGTTLNGAYTPWAASDGSQIPVTDNQLGWIGLGSYTWKPNTPVQAWYAGGAGFSVVVANGCFQVCTTGGTTGSSAPTFATSYGGTSPTDGDSVIWTCVGAAMTWAPNTTWYLPPSGFIPPSSSDRYGGASIIDSNSNVEFVTSSGLGGSSTPMWNTWKGGTLAATPNPGTATNPASGTTDNQAIWYDLEAFVAQSLKWSKGYSYAYSYKSLAFDDYYAALPLGGGNTPPGVGGSNSGGLNTLGWNGVPVGSATETVSSASPAFVMPTSANAGAVNTISGPYSPDPQVDTIIIWRSADGGGSGQMFELTEIPNKPGLAVTNWIAGQSPSWTFKDFLPDTAATVGGVLYPGLNTLIPAPINEVNNPPYSSFLPQAYNFERIWGSDGQYVEFSGGPDTLVGNPDECFNPSDNLPFLAPVIKLVKTSQGLVTFLTDSIEIIAGGPLTSSFFSVTCVPGMGLLSFNAADLYGGEIYFFASDNQFRVFTPALNVVNGGFPLGDQFANIPNSGISDTIWNPADVYVTMHQNGIDNCLMVADGSTGWYRQNPHQAGGIQGQDIVWSPYANITNGCRLVQSVETTPGIKQLLVGPTGPGEILERNLRVFTDNGTEYDAYFVMGSITLAHPGQLALLKFLTFEFTGVDFEPTISYLLNAISGTFQPFTVGNFVFDPPSIYGAVTTPQSYSPERYYFGSNAFLARCRHLQIKVDFGTTPNPDELLTMTIFGRLMVET